MPRAVEQHRYPPVVISVAAVLVPAVGTDRPEPVVWLGHEHLNRRLHHVGQHQDLGLPAPRVRSAHVRAVRVEFSLDEPLHLRASSRELVHGRVPQRVRPRRLRAEIIVPAVAPVVLAKRDPDGDGAKEASPVARHRVHLIPVTLRGASHRARRRRAPPRERPGKTARCRG